ncbi:MAG: hypothetical protein LAO79_24535 [Acidobacteriia bacterium]|nr:hypothetical protein [Terriglobia bacterium]
MKSVAAGDDPDNNPVFKIGLAGIATIVAGPATNASLRDFFNYRVRKVSGGVITTVAGNGISAIAGDGGPASGWRENRSVEERRRAAQRSKTPLAGRRGGVFLSSIRVRLHRKAFVKLSITLDAGLVRTA